MSIYKANDIRGLYPRDWNKETAFDIGYSLPEILPGKRIIIGRDGRKTSMEIFHNIAKGLNDRGVDVIDIGVVDTPAVYFAVGYYGYDGGVMITASHNPVEYNGLKITGADVIPINAESGLLVLRNIVESGESYPSETSGKIIPQSIAADYSRYLSSFKPHKCELKAVYDCSNGSIAEHIHLILDDFQENSVLINNSVEGDFPNHGPNPILPENLIQLENTIQKHNADIGFCFDGDGDRVVIVDKNGEVVSPDLITVLLGFYYFSLYPEVRKGTNKVLVDIRSTRAVGEILEELGAEVVICPVGHSKIKKMMRSEDAVYAGELTGHYYFRENFYSDSAWISVFRILTVLSEGSISLDELKNELSTYCHSGELNYTLNDSAGVIEALLRNYSDADISQLDGYFFEYTDWWFLIRESGTEPLLRVVIETQDKDSLNNKKIELEKIINLYV